MPVLWLFTDTQRLADPMPAIAALPPQLSGVVFRHDGVAGREALAREVAALCRAKGIALTVAGDWRLAASLGAGVHLRGGNGVAPLGRLNTASVHSLVELRRARQRGALPFLSPVFATASHLGAVGLGPWRWALMAGHEGAWALGGVTGASVGRLGRNCRGVGAIGALAARDGGGATPRRLSGAGDATGG